MGIRRQHIKHVVRRLLAEIKVAEPPVPVDKLAGHLGLVIRSIPHRTDVSGFLLSDPKRGLNVIGVNRQHPPNRQRFTIAHELGHFKLHQEEPVHVDEKSSFLIEGRTSKSSAGEDPREIEANAFAAELLMPEQFLRLDIEKGDFSFDLSDDQAVKQLAKRYEVSVSAMSFRLANLGYITL